MDFLTFVEGASVGIVVGCGLTYGFRGWIARTIAKEKLPVITLIGDVHRALTAGAAKSEAELRTAVDDVRTKLAKYI